MAMKELGWACYRVEVSMLKSTKESVTVSADFLLTEFCGRSGDERLFAIDIESCDSDEGMNLNLLGRELYPIEIYVSSNREIVGVRNWRESLRRVKRELRVSAERLKSLNLYDYLFSSVSNIESEEDFITMLMRNTFFQIMFSNYVGGDRIHMVYDYPNYGDNVPFVYEATPSKVCEDYAQYKAKLGRISAYNSFNYSGAGQFRYRFKSGFLPHEVHASFLFEAEESGFYKKEVHILNVGD